MRAGLSAFILLICAILLPARTDAAAPLIGPSGNPLPRFVSLSPEIAYLRTGPGLQYPVVWVYQRRHLPFEIIDEHGPWRQVRDIEGATGWMHVRLLSSKRTVLLVGRTLTLHADPDPGAPVVLTADGGVIGRALACRGDWCRLDIDGRKGWIERRRLWGVYPQETFE